jgi:hypothetical protein
MGVRKPVLFFAQTHLEALKTCCVRSWFHVTRPLNRVSGRMRLGTPTRNTYGTNAEGNQRSKDASMDRECGGLLEASFC